MVMFGSDCAGVRSVLSDRKTRAIRGVWYLPAMVLLLFVNLVVPANGEPKTFNDTRWPFLVTARKLCPDSHLELLTTIAVQDLFEGFLEALPPKTRTRFKRADHARCKLIYEDRSFQGLTSCQNAAYMETVSKLRLTDKFAVFACKSGVVCKEDFYCSDRKR